MSAAGSGVLSGPAGASLTRPIALLSAAAFVSAATMRVADPLVPQVAGEFATTAGNAAIMVTAFSLAYGICQALWGPLGDRFGKFRLVAIMTLASAITVGLSGLADSLAMLAAARLLAGATAAALIPLAMAFIGDHVAYEQRQTTIARFLSGQIMGLLSGQVFGGAIGDQLGWRAVFAVLAALYLAVGLLLVLELRRGRLPPPHLASAGGVTVFVRGVGGMLRRRWPRTVLVVVMLEGALFFGAFAFVGAWLHDRFGLSFTRIGLLLVGFGLGGLVFALNARWLVARLGERGLALGGGLLIAAGFLAIALAPAPLVVTGALGVLGLGFYMFHNTLQVNATQMAPDARGLAVATFASAFFLGQAGGAWLGGRIVDGVGYPPLFIAAGCGVLAIAVWFVLRRSTVKA
ncbi:MAG: MFS transporter [Geminicoccaceae bacterium]